MRSALPLVMGIVIVVSAAFPSVAAEVNLNATVVGAVPVGSFAESEHIINQAPYGWSASGGGASTGFGFNLELETRVKSIVMVGFRFGYVKYGADAADVQTFINGFLDASGSESEVTALDATWAHTIMSFPVRFIARDYDWGNTYVRFDVGWVKVGNSFDGTIRLEDPPMDQSFASDFNLGNQFFLAGGLGVDFRVGKNYAIITEVRFNQIFSRGAEATASVGGSAIRAEMNFDTQTVEIVVGLRIPLSGI